MESERFDELSKALARATSRRDALRYLGGAAAGAVLASLPGWHVLARGLGGGNSACAHFCAAVFGDDTPAAGQCTSDAAHHTGLCYQLGPSGSGYAPTSLCCARNASGYCTSYTGVSAPCGSDQTCQSGTCVTSCLGLQQSCTSPNQCCDTGQGKTTCESIGSGNPLCCNAPGGSCGNDGDCCGYTACGRGGTCQCLPASSPCLYDSGCCSGTCNNTGPGTLGVCS